MTNIHIEQGLDYLLEHFEEPIFPRTISTKRIGNKQVLVRSKTETLRYFNQAKLLDCRISAFSKYEIEHIVPNQIFTDLDNIEALDEVLQKYVTTLNAKPSVIFTGNGFALLQPINMNSWKDITQYGKTGEELAKLFLQYSSRLLSNNKCDSGNHPSLRSCLIRVPASINSKNGNQVRVYSNWNKRRVDIQCIPFKEYLEKIALKERQKRRIIRDFQSKEIPHIERLLQRKFTDCRKRLCNLIILPYLINIKRIPIEQVISNVYSYFDHYISKSAIRYEAKRVFDKGIRPIGLEKLKEYDYELYELVNLENNVRSNLC